jgi:hypothetical protein
MLTGNRDDMLADFLAVARPENGCTALLGIGLEEFQPDVEVIQDAVADFLAGVAQLLKIGLIGGHRTRAHADEFVLQAGQVLLQANISQLFASTRLEEHGLRTHQPTLPTEFSEPGNTPTPANTSAT